jgi:hypothetical protein
MSTRHETDERQVGEEPDDPSFGFGTALFDELKQTAIRRGGLTALARVRERLAKSANGDDQTLNAPELVRRLPRAAESVREYADIVATHAKALGRVADRTNKIDSTGATISPAIVEVISDLNSVVAALEDGAPTAQGNEAQPVVVVIDEIMKFYARVLQSDKKLDALSDQLRQIQTVQERLESDEIIGDEARKAALGRDLVGLAFSGGGIRSATFNLGILQGLASFGLLGMFDYLSTVSGGDYIGAWLAAWIHREGNLENVQKQIRPMRLDQAGAIRGWCDIEGAETGLKPEPVTPAQNSKLQRPNIGSYVAEEEPEPIYHLRRYSNYLAPTPGLLSVDTWSMLATYGRNLLLNQLVLLPAAMAVILIPRLFLSFFGTEFPDLSRLAFGIAMFALAGISLISTNRFVATRRLLGPDATSAAPVSNKPEDTKPRRPEVWRFVTLAALPLVAAAVLFSFLFSGHHAPYLAIPYLHKLLAPTASTGRLRQAATFGLFAGTLRVLWFLTSWLPGLVFPRPKVAQPIGAGHGQIGPAEFVQRLVISSLAAAASAGSLYAVMSWIRTLVRDQPDMLAPTLATFGPPVAILAILFSMAIESGMLGMIEEEEIREWRASLGAYLMMSAISWASIFLASLYGPLLLAAAGPKAAASLGTGWLATSISGVLAGSSSKTRGGKGGILEFFLQFVPSIFVAGLLVLVSMLACIIAGVDLLSLRHLEYSVYWQAMEDVSWRWTLPAFLAAAAIASVISWRLNVNLFSLHAFYANRLVRCYLGASRPDGIRPPGRPHYAPSNSPPPARDPNPITGFDRDDDFPLKELKAISKPVGIIDHGIARGYQGPLPLINTALNLVSGHELAWQERMAESFVLTPTYSGSKTTGYRRMDARMPPGKDSERLPGYGHDLRLGTAVSISGAAASPNMGYHSSPAVTFLMTVFNARLGWWLGNPAREKWREPGPRSGFYLFKELFGRTNSRSQYVYLSDGGHFENLGVYELVRRRCRFIVACDAGEDGELAFWDLGSLVRKCREDLGVRIEIDIAPILKQETLGKSRWHCSIGKIRYDDIDVSAIPGVLLYIKPSITGDEPTDIRNYVVDHPTFPHQSTSNQFFSESQFESYRALGDHIAQEVFRDAVSKKGAVSAGPLFAELRRRWFPPPPDFDRNFLKSVDAYIEIQGQLRTDPNLGRLSAELYPEIRSGTEGHSEQDRAEVHAIGQIVQVMENVWLAVGLENFAEHPMNRGWMNWFRRWSGSASFQRHWPALRGEFSQDFVRFAEKQLSLRVGRPALIACPPAGVVDDVFDTAIRRLDGEYVVEWPTRPWPGGEKYRPVIAAKNGDPVALKNRGGIVDLVAQARNHANCAFVEGKTPIWLIPESVLPGESETESFWNGRTCGVVLAWKVHEEGRGDVVELFAWLRGPYRTLGIGRDYVEEAIANIRRDLLPTERQLPLRVDYPMRDSPTSAARRTSLHRARHAPDDETLDFSGSKDRWQSIVWLSFFQGLGFRKDRPELPGQEVLSLYWSEPGS